MPAYLPSLGIAGVKIVNVHPDNPSRGLPTVMALTVILDIATGQPVAVINATRLTDMRTGAAGAVAARYLAEKRDRPRRHRHGKAGGGAGRGDIPGAEDPDDKGLEPQPRPCAEVRRPLHGIPVSFRPDREGVRLRCAGDHDAIAGPDRQERVDP